MTSDTIVGVILILVVGIGALVVAALLDLRAQRKAAARVAEAVHTGVPEVDEVTPHYISSDEALATATPLASLPDGALDVALSRATAVAARLADERCATHAPPATAVADGPLVLVALDGFGSAREALGSLDRAAKAGEALVLVAPEISADLLEVIAVNVRRGTLRAIPVIADAEACDEIAMLSGATPINRADLQSGYVPHSVYGRVALVMASALGSRWVSTSSESSDQTFQAENSSEAPPN